ncbi:MAG: Ig-like domain-containing protein [Candidatus Micrarchaeales archaeon]
MKIQSAVEFLMTYGFSLLIIATAIAAFYAYFLLKNPISYVQSTCSLSSLYCGSSILIKGNSTIPSYIVIYVTNSFSKPISFPQNSFKVTYQTLSFNGTCSPGTLFPGATSICIANLGIPLNIGSTLRFNLQIPFIYANQKFNASGITDVTVSPTISQSSFTSSSLSVSANSYNGYWPGDGVTPVKILATLKINNFPIRGMQVNFSTNDSRVVILPNVSITNASGVAVAYAKTTFPISQPIRVLITARSFSSTSTITINFMKKFEDFESGMNGWALDCGGWPVSRFVSGYASFSALMINSTGGDGLACAYKGVNVVANEVVSYVCRGYGCRLCVWNGSTCINSPDLPYLPFNGTWRMRFTTITRTQNGVNFVVYNGPGIATWAVYDNFYTSV